MNTNLRASIVQTVYSTVTSIPGVLGLSHRAHDSQNLLKTPKTFHSEDYVFSEQDIYVEGTNDEFVVDLHICILNKFSIVDLCNEIKQHIEYAFDSDLTLSNKKHFLKITVNKIM